MQRLTKFCVGGGAFYNDPKSFNKFLKKLELEIQLMRLAIVKACRVTSPASAKLSENPLNFFKPPLPNKKKNSHTRIK
jgi:hypothetical protein